MKNILIMKKLFTIIFVFTAIVAVSQPQLSFKFANPEYANGLFIFDVEVKASEAGALNRDLQLYINYNTGAFGSNIASNIGINQLDLLFPAFYEVAAIANNTDSKIAIITESLFEHTLPGYSGVYVEIPTEFSLLCKIIMPVVDASKAAGLSFDQQLMNGGQYLQDFNSTQALACADVCLYDNDWSNLSIPGQTLALDQGWSGISGYLVPENDNVNQIFAPVLADLVMLNDLNNIFYPAQNINTLTNWEYNSGYLLKMNSNQELKMNGSLLDSKNLDISQGWSLIPVLSDCEADVAELFSGYPATFIKEVAGWKVYWPDFGINTLNTLEPGKAYFAKMDGEALISFPDCSPLKSIELAGSGDRQNASADDIFVSSLMNKFNITRTASTHTIALPENAIEIDQDWIIIAFDENGNPFGMASWKGESTSLTVFGDDPLTEEKDGFLENDLIVFRAINQETKTETDLDITWDQSLPLHNGHFSTNGLSAVSGLKLSPTEIAESATGQMLIYPNPTSDKVNIEWPEGGAATISVINLEGQVLIHNQFSGIKTELNIANLTAGIYLIEIKGEKLLQTVRLIKK